MLEGGARPFDCLLEWLSIHIAARLSHQHKFSRRLPVRAEFLDSNRFPVHITAARLDVLILFCRKALDDIGFGERRRRLWLGYISDARDVMLWRWSDWPLWSILLAQW